MFFHQTDTQTTITVLDFTKTIPAAEEPNEERELYLLAQIERLYAERAALASRGRDLEQLADLANARTERAAEELAFYRHATDKVIAVIEHADGLRDELVGTVMVKAGKRVPVWMVRVGVAFDGVAERLHVYAASFGVEAIAELHGMAGAL